MKKHLGMVVLAGLVLVLLLVYTVSVPVSQLKDLVVVTTFGETTKVLSGRNPDQAGLHFKWIAPIQQEVRFDARTHLMEDTLERTSIKDGKAIDISVFCAWRIEDANRFLSAIRTVNAAQDRIKSAVRNAKTEAVGKMDLADLVNVDPAKMKLAEVEESFKAAVSDRLRQDYGVGVVMIGVKRLGLSKTVSETVIDTMKAERQAKAKDYTGTGDALARGIRERAVAEANQIQSFALQRASAIRAEGEQANAEFYKLFQQEKDLAVFLRVLDAVRRGLSSRAVILLDESSMPFIRWFRETPTAKALRDMTAGVPAAPPATQPAGTEK